MFTDDLIPLDGSLYTTTLKMSKEFSYLQNTKFSLFLLS